MNLQTLRDQVWSFRRQAADYWLTPDEFDSLCFAFTEAAEAIDTQLRQNGDFVRNHDKHIDSARELTQCAVMLVTALGPGHRYGQTEAWVDHRELNVYECARRVAHAYISYIDAPKATMWRVWAEAALLQIAGLLGDEFPQMVDQELARVEAMHGKQRLERAVAKCFEVVRKDQQNC